MKLTRRAAARMLGVSAALAGRPIQAQAPAAAEAPNADALLTSARSLVQQNTRDLAAVKLPRAVEPATRFEA